MPIDFQRQKRFLELKKLYTFDIAVLKQDKNNTDITDEELFSSLLLFDVQKKLTDAINDYMEDSDFAIAEISNLITALFSICGEIIGNVAGQHPEYLVLYRDLAMKQFDNHIKDFLNGKSK